MRRSRPVLRITALLGLALVASSLACTAAAVPSEPAPWEVRTGVETITVTGAGPGEPLTLYRRGRRLLLLDHGS